MARLPLHAAPLHAEIDPAFGACLTDFSVDGPERDRYPIMRRAPGELDAFVRASCFLMAPWVNRIAGAQFAFGGDDYSVRRSWEDGTAIHGDVLTRPWRILDRTPVSARLGFSSGEHEEVNFPFSFACVVRYELAPTFLRIDLDVTNTDRAPMPAACGVHPYFCKRLWSEDDAVTIRAGVTGRYPTEGGVPQGPAADDDVCERVRAGTDLGTLSLDDCFAGFDGRGEIAWPASGVKLTMDCSDALGHLVVYTPRDAQSGASPGAGSGAGLPWFCFEPQSAASDAFNLDARGIDAGVRTLAPGDTLHTSVTMHVEIT